MTELEFRTKVLMGRLSEGKPNQPTLWRIRWACVPDAWEWNDLGAVTRVKQQGSVGLLGSATGTWKDKTFGRKRPRGPLRGADRGL